MSDTDMATLDRAEYEAFLDRLEDANDHDYLPLELVERLCAGEHPVRVWRAHRSLTREALAAAAGIAPSYLTEIETGKKPGSFAALAKLAAALNISLDDIAAWTAERR
jgi:DNA-binding XRE family transcriptional regulator